MERRMRHVQCNVDVLEELKDATGGQGVLKIVGLWETDLTAKQQTHTRRTTIEFNGEAQASNGEVIQIRRKYEINKELAEQMVKGFDDLLGRDHSRRPPAMVREYVMDLRDDFTISLRVHPKEKGKFIGLSKRDDGWEFFTEKVDLLLGTLSQAVQ